MSDFGLIHKQIRLPAFVKSSDKMANESDVIRPHNLTQQRHKYFIGRPVAFFVITSHARTNEVFPRIFPAARFGNNMVYRQWDIAAPAVLTPVIIATQNIFPGEDNFFVGKSNEDGKPYDARKGHRHRDGMKESSVGFFDQLGFPEDEENNSFFDVADT